MSALAVSQIQKHFITNEIYKRSKRYFDVIKLNSIQHNNSKSRRKPHQLSHQQIDRKIQQSFMSSEDFYNKRRQEEIQKSKKKNCSCCLHDDKDEIQTNCSMITKYHSTMIKKGFDMGKALSREFYQNLQNVHNYTSIQQPFDNYVISDFSKGQKGKSIDFKKILGRKDTSLLRINSNIKSRIQDPESLNPEKSKTNRKSIDRSEEIDPNKIYQKYAYDQSTFKCLFNVQKERKKQNRKSLQIEMKTSQPKQLDLEKIQKGRSFSRRKPTPSSLMFYYGKGKEDPSQMHLRTLKKNENYWVQQLKIMKKQDFEVVKRRQQMIEKKIKQYRQKKQVIDVRGEICDAKYFLRFKEK